MADFTDVTDVTDVTNYEQVALLLLENGAEVNKVSNQSVTALNIACDQEHEGSVARVHLCLDVGLCLEQGAGNLLVICNV